MNDLPTIDLPQLGGDLPGRGVAKVNRMDDVGAAGLGHPYCLQLASGQCQRNQP